MLEFTAEDSFIIEGRGIVVSGFWQYRDLPDPGEEVRINGFVRTVRGVERHMVNEDRDWTEAPIGLLI